MAQSTSFEKVGISLEMSSDENDINIKIKTEVEDDDYEEFGPDCVLKESEEFQEFKYVIPPKRPKKQKHENLLCPICGKIFTRKPYLDKHISTVHEGAKAFKCDDCGRCFGQKGTLKLHKKCVHEKNREFICAICSKDFTYKQSLLFHTKTVHVNVNLLHHALSNLVVLVKVFEFLSHSHFQHNPYKEHHYTG